MGLHSMQQLGTVVFFGFGSSHDPKLCGENDGRELTCSSSVGKSRGGGLPTEETTVKSGLEGCDGVGRKEILEEHFGQEKQQVMYLAKKQFTFTPWSFPHLLCALW